MADDDPSDRDTHQHVELEPYDPHRGGVDLGRLWTLHKAHDELALYVHTDPLPGWQLRLVREGELLEQKTVKNKGEVFMLANTWRTRAEKEGWSES